MDNSILLSIVTPTRGDFSDFWLQSLMALEGAVEFVLVYPPGTTQRSTEDPRFKSVISPYKGEMIQRAIGLLNASGQYVIALDDDDFIHPKVVELIKPYFSKYPDSWCLRLHKANISYQDEARIKGPWASLPDLDRLKVIPPSPKPTLRRQAFSDDEILEEIPIAPLYNRFKLYSLWFKSKRKDQDGAHLENFNNRIWKAHLAQEAVQDLLGGNQFSNYLVWMPFWSLDRLLGLFLQAKFYEKDAIVGHRLWGAEQVRYIKKPSSLKGELRAMFPADMLLALRFPRYGYLWNLFFYEFWRFISICIQGLFRKASP